MLTRLNIVKQRFDEVSDLIINPDVIADQKRYVQLNKEYKDLKAIVEKRDEYVMLQSNIDEANELLADGSDTEMVEMAKLRWRRPKNVCLSLKKKLNTCLSLKIRKMLKTLW